MQSLNIGQPELQVKTVLYAVLQMTEQIDRTPQSRGECDMTCIFCVQVHFLINLIRSLAY